MIENGGKGIETSYGAAETYIDNCIVLNNTKAQISCTSQQGAAGLSDDLIRTRITNSTVATNKSYHLVEFYELDLVKGTTASKGQRWQASANKYWSNVPAAFVTSWWDKPVDSATYKQRTSQDTDTLWQQPDFKALYAYDPTVQRGKTSP
jgi:hypothetical protein